MNEFNDIQEILKNRNLDTYRSSIIKVEKLSNIDLKDLIEYAETLVFQKLRRIKIHQIRRFFDTIKKIKIKVKAQNDFTEDLRAKLLMLRPQLANASAKQMDLLSLYDICSIMIGKVDNESDFDRFSDFFESLVAFHKVHAFDKN